MQVTQKGRMCVLNKIPRRQGTDLVEKGCATAVDRLLTDFASTASDSCPWVLIRGVLDSVAA